MSILPGPPRGQPRFAAQLSRIRGVVALYRLATPFIATGVYPDGNMASWPIGRNDNAKLITKKFAWS
jgi:hypothetical protein